MKGVENLLSSLYGWYNSEAHLGFVWVNIYFQTQYHGMWAKMTAINRKIHSTRKDVLEDHGEDEYRDARRDSGPM